MNPPRTRRATVDDLPQLIALWQAAHLPADVFEKQFTDFQVVEGEEGAVIAALGLQISGHQGRVYGETFGDFSLSDSLRPALWQRLQVVAQNHGLVRVWTEEDAPWWKRDAGFVSPATEENEKFPAGWGDRHERWLTLRLRDEAAAPSRVEEEMEKFKQAERAKREKMVFQGKVINAIAILIASGLLLFGLVLLVRMVMQRR